MQNETRKTAAQSIPLTRIQKLIGSLMLESKQTKAAGYMTVWADVTELASFRKQYSRSSGVRVTTNDLILYAMARSLLQYPLLTGRLDADGSHLIIPESIGLGFAVAAPQGLVVPVIHEAEKKNLIELAQASDEYLKKARSNKLLPDDFEGATMVLSALGMYGIEWFYAIAPPSASGIISIGYIQEQIAVIDGKPTPRKRISISLASDHRVADEFTAASFLRAMADQLEDPQSMF